MSFLATERLRLMPPDPSMAPVILDYFQRNRAFFKPWTPRKATDFFTLDAQRDSLRGKAYAQREGTLVHFYVFSQKDMDNNFLLGQVSCSNIIRGPLQSCFLGYSVDKEANGQGVATEALQAVIRYAFEELGLHRVEANIMPSNLASIRVAEKLGFVREGLSKHYLKINGQWEDHVRMALLSDVDFSR